MWCTVNDWRVSTSGCMQDGNLYYTSWILFKMVFSIHLETSEIRHDKSDCVKEMHFFLVYLKAVYFSPPRPDQNSVNVDFSWITSLWKLPSQ